MSLRYCLIVTLTGLGIAGLGALGGCPPDDGPPDGNSPPDGNTPVEKTDHERFLTEVVPGGYEGPATCQICHADVAADLLESGHWQWAGASANIVGHETETHGKRDLLNNFCIAVPSNEGRCAQCHPSYGWKDDTFDFTSTAQVDCFICHDTTGTYAKHPTDGGGGGAAALVNEGQVTVVGPDELQQVAYNVGPPTRRNCGFCHFYAGGGDNVKHGDMSSDLASPTREMDVHMGGLDFACQECHTEQNHGIAGFALHSVNEGGAAPACTRCHGDTDVHTANPPVDPLLNAHLARLACETCHIPAFARSKPTKVAWYWDTAGQDISPIPTDELGQPTYDKQKGTFVWAKDVQPEYRWHNGLWRRMIIGVSDTYTVAGTAEDPVVIAEPAATKDDADAKIYPFKKMVGRQPADTLAKRLSVPHLFGTTGGANPYWVEFDWGLALADGAAYTGIPFTGTYGFPETVMYLKVSHEVAPKEMALGCEACHGVPAFWAAVGLKDPLPGPPKPE